jgi:hypothetical protein
VDIVQLDLKGSSSSWMFVGVATAMKLSCFDNSAPTCFFDFSLFVLHFIMSQLRM